LNDASHSLPPGAGIRVSRAAERLLLVADRSVRCPACSKLWLAFKTDRIGRAFEECGCGYRAYVERRSGKRDAPAEAAS
jgi:hypothetical protein